MSRKRSYGVRLLSVSPEERFAKRASGASGRGCPNLATSRGGIVFVDNYVNLIGTQTDPVVVYSGMRGTMRLNPVDTA